MLTLLLIALGIVLVALNPWLLLLLPFVIGGINWPSPCRKIVARLRSM